MKSYILSRTLQSFVSLLGLVVLAFFLVRLTGNPADLYLPDNASAQARQEFIEMHGLDDPLVVQFARFCADLVVMDLGQSLRQGRPASTIVLEAYPISLLLAAITMIISITLSIVIGVWAAVKPGGGVDRTISILSLGGASAPSFWVALTLISIFAVWLRWLPTSGIGSVQHWIMPITVLTLYPLGMLSQVVRESMITAMAAPYVRTARAKGARESSIMFVHALKNASLPILTMAGNIAVGFVNGSVIVETVFGFPGVGKLMIGAILQRDFAVVQASVLITAVVIFAMNIMIDICYAFLDPRIRQR